MLLCKTFYAVNGYLRPGLSLEDAINSWLRETQPFSICSIQQAASGRLDHHVTVSVFYEPRKEE